MRKLYNIVGLPHRDKAGLFGDNLCVVKQREGRNSITEAHEIWNLLK